MPNETEPTQMSPEQVALHAECKVEKTEKVWDTPPTTARQPMFTLGGIKEALGAGETPDEILDELDAKAEKVVNDKDISGEAELLLKANMALGRLVTENMVILVTAIAGIQDMLHSLREGLKGGREVNEGRMSVMLGRLDVLEDTLRGKMELNQREVMTRLGVVENAAAQAVCRSWDRRPFNMGGGGGGEPGSSYGGGGGGPAEPDYHDKAPGV